MSQQSPPHRRPVIGVTADYNDALTHYAIPYPYCAAVEAAGGLPLILPYRMDLALIPQYVDQLDGILFCGGNDLDPSAWGESIHPKAEAIDPHRERFERALLAEVERRRLPTMGICLGSQLMNVHRGGSLNQFIPDLGLTPGIEHRRLDKDWAFRHPVTVEPDSIVGRAVGGATVESNSSHKQSIRQLGQNLRVTARASDGTVEAIEDPSMPLWFGVQWHPERQHTEPQQHALFVTLVEAARQTRR